MNNKMNPVFSVEGPATLKISGNYINNSATDEEEYSEINEENQNGGSEPNIDVSHCEEDKKQSEQVEAKTQFVDEYNSEEEETKIF